MHAMLTAATLLCLALPCLSAAGLKNGDVRLVGSRDYFVADERRVIGRLVVYYNGHWGNVCAHNTGRAWFGSVDTEVACDQLGGLDYYHYDDEGLFYEWPQDTGHTFLEKIECVGEEPHLSECPRIEWIGHPDECYPEEYALSISCSAPPAEGVTDSEFVFDVGFSDSGFKCGRADGLAPSYYDSARRRRSFTSLPPTPAPTHDDSQANFDTSAWEVAACHSVYSGAAEGEVEIIHKGQLDDNEICARRTDGQPWQNLYLRLLCRIVDLNSTMVSYTSKGSCGPRGRDAVADTSHCLLGASVVASVQSEQPIPAAVVDGCAFFSYTEYLCLEDTTESAMNTTFTSTTTATGCVDYVPPEEEKWYDADGELYDCAWYAGGLDCSQLGGSARNFNRTADEACCACGGGIAGPRTTTTRAARTASATQTATAALVAPGAQLHEVTGSLRFSSNGSQQQVHAAAAEALAELLGVLASEVVVEVSPAVGTNAAAQGGRQLSSIAGWWQVSYTVWSTVSVADAQRRSVAELARSQAAASAFFAPRFEAAGLQLDRSTLEVSDTSVGGAAFTDTTTTATTTTSTATTTTIATTTGAQTDESGGEDSATTDATDQLPVVLGFVAVVLAALTLMIAIVGMLVFRREVNALRATNDVARLKASAEAAGTLTRASDVYAV